MKRMLAAGTAIAMLAACGCNESREAKALKEQVSQKQDDVLRGLLTRRAHTPATPASKSKDNLLDPAKDKDLAQAEPKLPVAAGLVASIIGKM